MFFNNALKQQLLDIQQQQLYTDAMFNAFCSKIPVVQFSPDGQILSANDLFLSSVSYRLDEVINQHHRIFCDSQYAASTEYNAFWRDLKAGKANKGTFLRYGKHHKPVWL